MPAAFAKSIEVNTFAFRSDPTIGYSDKTATKGMTKVTPKKVNAGSSFTLHTCPVHEERSVH